MEIYHNKDKVFEFYLKMISLLCQDQIEAALNQLNEYRLGYPKIIGMGVSDNSIIKTDVRRLKQTLETKYLINSLSIDEFTKKRILSIIAIDFLQSSFVINTHDLFIQEFLKVYNVLECEPLIDFVNNNPTGLFSHCESDDEYELAEIFFHSIINNAYNIVLLSEYQTIFSPDFLEGRYLGIEVQPGDDRCHICKGKRILRYSFKEKNELPSLPLYPGCLCWYSLYSKDDL
ncbi:MAG: hypothetical protein IM572_01740 [Chitinophagaceae bacterium]|nr:hypothetical protein [Chitinophagaceae bacterium]MCA6512442.1 hypothetical protein [Chitinophagaceae bacterium]